MDQRSPLESLFGIIGGLPQGHDKLVKQAVYNAVALLLLFLCSAVSWALFIILEPFVKPLIWAVLVGSVLHPLKRSLRDKFQTWFRSLDVSNTPVLLGVVLLPINIVNDLSDFIGNRLLKRIKIIIGIGVALLTVFLMYHMPRIVTCLIYKAYIYSYALLNFFIDNANLSLVSVLIIGYLSLIFFLWKPGNNTKFHYAAIGMWLFLSCCIAHLFGSFQMIVFIILQVVLFGGFGAEVYHIYKVLNTEGQSISFMEALSSALHDKSDDSDISEEAEDSKESSELQESAKEEKVEEIVREPSKENLPVKFPEEEIGDKVSKLTKQDPWNLELFEEKPEVVRDSELGKTSLLITKQGILISQPTSILSDILKPQPKKELKRSLTQPQLFNATERKRLWDLRNRKLKLKTSNQSLLDTEKYGSTFYLYSVTWACIVMVFWKNFVLLPLLFLPILFYSVKRLGNYFGIWKWLFEHFNKIFNSVSVWCHERHDALVPVPIRGLYRVVHTVNNFLKTSVKDSIDTVASCVVICGLIIFLACASIFILVQVYTEAIMMVQITSNVINQTVVHNPELRQFLPPAWDETMDSILDNAYQYGREGISTAVRNLMSNVDSVKAEKLENQVLELWDRLYQSWMSTNDSNGPKVTQDAVRISWENFMNDIQKSPEMFNINGIVEFAKQNVGTLLSLLESVWVILKGNIGLLLGSFSAFISIILGGGTAVLNFILSGIVFITALFYLLSCSGDLYKPVEVLTNFSSSGRRLGHALEGAINGVFTASFKMAVFYGLWTWFIHNLFGVKIVYLPSAFAAIFGAVPVLGTYWACIPAVLDLWLAQERGVEAILFAVCHFLPTGVVDTTIYKEIKGGGHPYLTALAIAGGILCLGVEGAIFGPLLLCGLYVAIDLSSSLFRESPSEEPINVTL